MQRNTYLVNKILFLFWLWSENYVTIRPTSKSFYFYREFCLIILNALSLLNYGELKSVRLFAMSCFNLEPFQWTLLTSIKFMETFELSNSNVLNYRKIVNSANFFVWKNVSNLYKIFFDNLKEATYFE